MKKVLSVLCVLLLLVSCNKDEIALDIEPNVNTNPQKVRWYGLKKTEKISIRNGDDQGKLWNQKTGIHIKFLNKSSDTDLIEKVKTIASEWETYADIKFHFVENDQKANVRIAFDWQGNDWLTWAYTGTDANYIQNQNEPTAVFGGLQYQDSEQFKGDVLRVFGQILGLEYEQRHQGWTFWKNESQLREYWGSMFEGMDLDWTKIQDYVFTTLNGESAIFPTQTEEIDGNSVMAWPYYTKAQTIKLLANYELSEKDKEFIAILYPKNKNGNLPTIQEAWVDTGYFEWKNPTKTSLRITALGAEQEYLPDVSDGEQLTSANSLFFNNWNSKLKKAPFFNTSNITDFTNMFKSCYYLTSIPQLDTSKGTNFTGMFEYCKSLTAIPQLDTSKGTNFTGMFLVCESLTSIPQLDTSKGTNFTSMFNSCFSLTSIPLLDTSNGTDFSYMFSYCSSLTLIPNLNTANGTKFSNMFLRCSSLTSIPQLDTAKGTEFSNMFSSCSSLTSIPNLNTAKGTNFAGMFQYCYALTSIPLLDTSNGTDFSNMFYNCASLKTKPILDLSNAFNTDNMFAGTPFG